MANNFYTYKIVFDSDGGEGGNNTPASPQSENEINTKTPSEPKKKSSDGRTAIATSLFQKLGTETVSFVTSNVERWTGSSVQQNKVNNAMKMVGYAGAFAVNPYLAGITLAVDIGTSLYNYTYELNWRNKESQENARRLGIINNRSR